MAMYGEGSGTFSGSNSMGEYDSMGYGFSPYDPGVGLWDPTYSYSIPSGPDQTNQEAYVPMQAAQPTQPPPPSQGMLAAQMDMANRGTWGQGYQSPQMNPMQMYGGQPQQMGMNPMQMYGGQNMFNWGNFAGMFGGK